MSIPNVNIYQHKFLASAARGPGTATSDAVSTSRSLKALVMQVDITAVGGISPTLTVTLQDSFDGSNWNKVSDLVVDAAAAGRTVVRLNTQATPATNRLRVSYTIAGTTPSFTFAVDAFFIQE